MKLTCSEEERPTTSKSRRAGSCRSMGSPLVLTETAIDKVTVSSRVASSRSTEATTSGSSPAARAPQGTARDTAAQSAQARVVREWKLPITPSPVLLRSAAAEILGALPEPPDLEILLARAQRVQQTLRLGAIQRLGAAAQGIRARLLARVAGLGPLRLFWLLLFALSAARLLPVFLLLLRLLLPRIVLAVVLLLRLALRLLLALLRLARRRLLVLLRRVALRLGALLGISLLLLLLLLVLRARTRLLLLALLGAQEELEVHLGVLVVGVERESPAVRGDGLVRLARRLERERDIVRG